MQPLFAAVGKNLEAAKVISSPTLIRGAHYFPNPSVKRGIWLDAEDDGMLASIAHEIKKVTSKFGIVPESRPYVPHVTIARIKSHGAASGDVRLGNDRFPDLQKLWMKTKFSVQQFFPTSVVLFQSTLSPGGSSYRILNEFMLQHG